MEFGDLGAGFTSPRLHRSDGIDFQSDDNSSISRLVLPTKRTGLHAEHTFPTSPPLDHIVRTPMGSLDRRNGHSSYSSSSYSVPNGLKVDHQPSPVLSRLGSRMEPLSIVTTVADNWLSPTLLSPSSSSASDAVGRPRSCEMLASIKVRHASKTHLLPPFVISEDEFLPNGDGNG